MDLTVSYVNIGSKSLATLDPYQDRRPTFEGTLHFLYASMRIKFFIRVYDTSHTNVSFGDDQEMVSTSRFSIHKSYERVILHTINFQKSSLSSSEFCVPQKQR